MLHPRLRIALAVFMPIALLVTIGLVTWVGLRLQKQDLAARERWQPIFRLDVTRVTGLRVATGGDDVRLARDGKRWRIHSPVQAEANADAVAAILGQIVSLERRATVAPAGESAERLRVYGLDAPSAVLEVTLAGGRTERLALGASMGQDGVMFAMPTSGDVVVIPASARAVLEKRLSDLRARPSGAAPMPAAEPAGPPVPVPRRGG